MQYLDRLCETFINANNEYVCIQPKNPEKGAWNECGGSGRVGSSFSIRVAQNNVLGWRWTVEKEHDGFFEPVASGRSLTRKMAKRAAIKAMNELRA